eukprot:4946298-Alexandrium_andersonii.AAC.1
MASSIGDSGFDEVEEGEQDRQATRAHSAKFSVRTKICKCCGEGAGLRSLCSLGLLVVLRVCACGAGRPARPSLATCLEGGVGRWRRL